ncbi:MAG: class I SAM-dependent methyltransferase [Clostridia bacterium]|nr:class I SAM-dependent methyltransferase [Clostridia bacterium]
MSGYGTFSSFYDRLMGRVDYESRCDYLLAVFARHGLTPKSLIDLGCGGGRMTRLLANKGFDMIGVDASAEMLSIAMSETPCNSGILWVCQDLRELDLYGTSNGAVSTYDCLNHLTEQGDLRRFFERLYFFLDPGGLLVFDANTPYKHEQVLGNNTFVYDTPDVYCVWQNQTEDAVTRMTVDLFAPQGEGYVRTTEQITERAYSIGEMEQAACGKFTLLAVYDDMTFEQPKEQSQRLIYVMKKQ